MDGFETFFRVLRSIKIRKTKIIKIGTTHSQNARFWSSERPRNLSKIYDVSLLFAICIKIANGGLLAQKKREFLFNFILFGCSRFPDHRLI